MSLLLLGGASDDHARRRNRTLSIRQVSFRSRPETIVAKKDYTPRQLRLESGPPILEISLERIPVLFADDQEVERKLAERTLWWGGFEPLIVSDGASAIRQAELRRPPVIVLDGLMPRISGFDASNEIKGLSLDYRPRVIVITGVYRALRYKNEAWRDFGVDLYLVKPVASEKFIESVRAQVAWLTQNDPSQLSCGRMPETGFRLLQPVAL